MGNEQEVSQESSVQLTDITKVEATETVQTPGVAIQEELYGMPNQAPKGIFERKYLLYEGNLEDDTDLQILPFQAVTETTLMQRILLQHRFFRCSGVMLDVQITAPVSMAGFVAVYWYPMQPYEIGTSYAVNRTWHEFVPMDFATLAVADSESVEMFVKWQAPYTMVSQRPSSNSTRFNKYPDMSNKLKDLGQLRIKTVSLLQVDQTSPSASIRVYGSLVDPYVAGPRSTNGEEIPEGLPPNDWYEPEVIVPFEDSEHQSSADGSGVNMGQMPGWSNMGILSAAAAATLSLTSINKQLGEFSKTFNETRKTFDELYCSVIGCEEAEPEKPEGLEMKADKGNHLNVRQNVWGDTTSLDVTPFISRLSEIPTIRPIDPKISGTMDESDIYALCRRWSYQSDIDFQPPPGGNALAQEQIYRAMPESSNHGYMRFFAQFFRLWRGSIEYRFKFFGTPLATYQVVINVNFDRNALLADRTFGKNAIGDTPTTMVTVRGTTTASVIVPYIRESPWARMDEMDVPTVSFSIFRISSNMGSTTTEFRLPTLVMVRAGTDFRFRSLVSGPPIRYSIPDFLGQPMGSPQDVQDSEFQGLIDHSMGPASNSGYAKTVLESQAWHGTIKDIIMRDSTRSTQYWRRLPGADGTAVHIDTLEQRLRLSYDNFDIMALIFAGYSGSTIVKAQLPDPDQNEDGDAKMFLSDIGGRPLDAASYKDFWNGHCQNGLYRTDLNIWKWVELEQPFICPWAFMPLSGIFGLWGGT